MALIVQNHKISIIFKFAIPRFSALVVCLQTKRHAPDTMLSSGTKILIAWL